MTNAASTDRLPRRAPRSLRSSLAMFLTVGVVASAAGQPDDTTSQGASDAIEALSGMDALPGSSTLTRILAGDVTTLVALANAEGGDAGVRLRAYRSLGEFKDEAARTGLKLALDRYSFADDGTDLLYLIAAAEAFGAIATDQDAGALGRMLNSSSRDLRVVVASALGRVASTEACNLLRARRRVEQVDQVRIAIDEAAASCVQ